MAGVINAARVSPWRGMVQALPGLLAALVLVLSAHFSVAFADPVYPELAGRVTDEAGLLTPTEKTDIEADLASLEQTSTDQLAVVTVKSLQGYSIEDYGIGLARKWGIGQKGKDNGILLIVAPNDRKVRIEVGRRLEPFMTDTMAALIIQNAILPKFRRGDYAGGIKDGVRDIKSVVLGDAEEVKRRAAGPRTPENDPTVIFHIILFLAIVAFIIWVNYRNAQAMRAGMPGAPRRRGGIVVIPGGSGDWGGGWSGGGGDSGGGGWSGGGGDFGGGGASGGW
ncbi:TPM domain-containing protein [Hyphomicrobium sp. DY-1]|uniref:TPM domain-containing protein n=1 Tax=Hyphomicrobium sp. DY-1 TaxID=3075650 RepID=UPI0039C28BC7